jgi:hypothetical protein
MDKEWKKQNMKLITQIYLNTEIKNIDDWIRISEEVGEEPGDISHQEIRSIVQDFHSHHYWAALEEAQDPRTVEDVLNFEGRTYKMMKEAPPLTDEFKKNY